MKKKRKKITTSPFCQVVFQSPVFMKATFPLEPRLHSAPDVPKSERLNSCLRFATQLFGKHGWPIDTHEDNVILRILSKQLTEKLFIHYETVHVDDCLFLHMPLERSRESFVALMDYAEEELGVSRMIVCLESSSQTFRELVKTFRFMGFEHIQPNTSLASIRENLSSDVPGPSLNKGFHYLGYDFD